MRIIHSLNFIITLFQVHEFTMGMTCEGCAGAAKRVLGKLGGRYRNFTPVDYSDPIK